MKTYDIAILGGGPGGYVAALRACLLYTSSGFDGWLCIEEYTNRGVKGVAEAAAYVRKTWDQA